MRIWTMLGMVGLLAAGLALAAPSGSAQAQAFTETFRFEAPFEEVVTGCQEDIAVSGTAMVLLHITKDEAGGVHVRLLAHVTATGTGLNSGQSYTFVATSSGVEKEVSGNAPGPPQTEEIDFGFTSILTRRQGGLEMLLRSALHLTLNAQGELTAEHISIVEAECTGPESST